MKFSFKRSAKKLIGLGLLALGFAALVTPFTPGSWLIFIGAELLGVRLLFWRRLREYVRSKISRGAS